MFDKILIANRGEIACRVIATCQRLGVKTVAVYSDADEQAQHVKLADQAYRIGAARPSESYLRIDTLIDTAQRSGAQAIHPGYGFLSENAAFARACRDAGLVFVGPTPEAIEQMGSKSAAKRLMERAGVPVVPGYHGSDQAPALLQQEAQRIGYPLLVKAVAGGGGKGMRLVSSRNEFSAQLEAAKREAANAFADDAVLLERYVTKPHHIEFQVFGDRHGNIVHLFERECSIQRRHQKVLEETPSPFLDAELRARMAQAAVTAARAIAYQNAGTIEFIVGADRDFYFMEMNTRLQVEHPITEMVTGVDLVEWQLRVAAGEALPLKQEEIAQRGHAIEVRVCAENPQKDFLPDTGRVLLCEFAPQHARVDTGVASGDEISIYYDSMIAKLIAYGEHRRQAIERLRAALLKTAIIGPSTNLALLQRLTLQRDFIAGKTDTHFIEQHREELLPDATPSPAVLAAAAIALRHTRSSATLANADPDSPWSYAGGWRLNADAQHGFHLLDRGSGKEYTLRLLHGATCTRLIIAEQTYALAGALFRGALIGFELDGSQQQFHFAAIADRLSIVAEAARYEFENLSLEAEFSHEPGAAGRLTALMPGRVIKVLVAAGESVKQGQPLLIMEAMKMEHTITSPRDGVVARVIFKANDIVPGDALLFEFSDSE